jgi:hypothetical protein
MSAQLSCCCGIFIRKPAELPPGACVLSTPIVTPGFGWRDDKAQEQQMSGMRFQERIVGTSA